MEHSDLLGKILFYIIPILELMGTTVILVSAIKSFYKYCKNSFRPNETIKLDLAQSLALALEFKLGAEILKTVIIRTMDEMYILAAVIILRTILTFVIHWEIKTSSKIESSDKREAEST